MTSIDDDELAIQLTEREMLIANTAANMAVKKMTDNFYKEVGKNFVGKLFVIIGACVVAFAFGRGWDPFKG